MKFSRLGSLLVILLFLFAEPAAATEKDRNVLDVHVVSEPAHVHPARFFFMTLTVTAPRDGFQVRLPDPEPFFEGFRVAGFFDLRHELPDGGFQVERNLRLQPNPGAPRYRMAPLAIEWDHSSPDTSPSFGYQLVPAIHFERDPIPHGPPTDIAGFREIPFFLLYRRGWLLAAVCAGLIFFAALTMILRRPLRTTSPAPQRDACAELDALAERCLPQREDGTGFYPELTTIVRRFIERELEFPARGRTTGELLETIRKDPRVDPAWIASAADFFSYLDNIKYSGRRSDRRSDRALSKARHVIKTMSQEETDNVAHG